MQARKAATVFNDLPNEIISRIFKSRILRQPRELRSLCLTSKSFYIAALPLLYSAYSYHLWSGLKILNPESLRLFMRTLIERPDYARLVKFLDLDLYAPNDLTEDEEENEISGRINKLFSSHWPLDCSNYEILLSGEEDISKAYYHAKNFVLLLSLTPNLTKLQFKRQWLSPIDSYLKQAKSWGPEHPFLENLTHLSIGWYDTENGWSLETVLELLKLPNLVTFIAHMCCNDGGPAVEPGDDPNHETPQIWTNSPGFLKLRHIEFYESMLYHDVISWLVLSCVNLESFKIEFGSYNIGHFGLHSMDFTKIGNAFKTRKDSLESLILDFRTHDCPYLIDDAIGHMDLRDFHKLTHVNVPVEALFTQSEL